MLNIPAYIIWIAIGLALCTGEIFVGAFVLLVFGIGSLLTGFTLMATTGNSIEYQLMIYILYTVITGVITYYVLRKTKAPAVGQSDEFVGEVGYVIQPLEEHLAPGVSGQVRFYKSILGSDIWDCQTAEGTKLKVGEKVKIKSFLGKSVLVEATQ